MTDRDRIEIDMSPGMQPPSGADDRLLVGLALVVLIGAAVIAVGNALPDPDEAAQASVVPSSSRTARPSPTPEPPRLATMEEPDVEFAPPEQYTSFGGWVRALSDIVIWSSTDQYAAEVGVLKEGEVAEAYQVEDSADPGWLALQGPSGFIKGLEGGIERVRRYEYPQFRSSGWVGAVAAGPEGFLALVTPPADPYASEPGITATSADGGRWRSADAPFFSAWDGQVAWGPIGWLAASYMTDSVGGQGRIVLWNSADGLGWTRLGMLGGVTNAYLTRLIGSADGYLLETYPEGGGYAASGNTIWSSADGRTWRESLDPVLQHLTTGERKIAALRHGFYMWDEGDPANHTPFGAFSLDGQIWSEVESPPDGSGLQFTEFEGRIVAIDLNAATMGTRVWSATVDHDGVSWIRETGSDAAFTGGVVRQVVSDDSRVFAFGWDLLTAEPLVWTGDGVDWLRSSLPEAFGGIPALAAGGPAGVVVVGQRHTLRGDNPIFWHRAVTGRWVPEPEPLLELVPDPPTDQCAELPSDVLEFFVVDVAAVITCHGDTPFTFRAYSVTCNGCYGTRDDNPQPAWLMNPSRNQLYLAPNDRSSNWSTSAILGPALAPLNPDWTNAWIELTGHFDDPAARTCHVGLTAGEIQWWPGALSVVEECRRTFVVTAVQVVSGP